jgi:hypothetical protein
MQASFEYLSIGQSMNTEAALTLLDKEVHIIECRQDSLSIDYDPNINGFSLFYITFDGSLQLKNQMQKLFKLSFMIEGKLIREGWNNSIKETVITVKASKMDIEP